MICNYANITRLQFIYLQLEDMTMELDWRGITSLCDRVSKSPSTLQTENRDGPESRLDETIEQVL